MNKPKVSIIAEDSLLEMPLKQLLKLQGLEVSEAKGPDFISSSQDSCPDLIIIVSSGVKSINGLEVARELRWHDRKTPIILITSYSSEEMAIEALRIGVTDFLKLPFRSQDLAASINRSLNMKAWANSTALDLAEGYQIIGESSAITKITDALKTVALTDCTALITGETGTGKELAAKFLHNYSQRRQYPFVVINCAAIPDNLLESELFGYEKGAFTGAHSKRQGAIRSANHGTLFFDEIGDMSPYAQAKILRTIENKEVWPVGGKRSLPVDVRLVAATNLDLEQLMTEGKFRSDLYFRLNVARIHLPPLRERKGDIVILLDYFRRKLNKQFGKEVEGFSHEAMAVLMDYAWPGNIRELKNLLEAMFIGANKIITPEDFPELFRRCLQKTKGLSEDERSRLLAALFETDWNKTQAAQRLNWSRMTLYRKMAKYGVISPAREEPGLGRLVQDASNIHKRQIR
jgi:DNA-binding NtrC family response regulator